MNKDERDEKAPLPAQQSGGESDPLPAEQSGADGAPAGRAGKCFWRSAPCLRRR